MMLSVIIKIIFFLKASNISYGIQFPLQKLWTVELSFKIVSVYIQCFSPKCIVCILTNNNKCFECFSFTLQRLFQLLFNIYIRVGFALLLCASLPHIPINEIMYCSTHVFMHNTNKAWTHSVTLLVVRVSTVKVMHRLFLS